MKIQAANFSLALGLSLATATAVVTFTGCVAGDRYHRSTGEYIDDKSLDSRVKDALSDNAEYKFDGVNITAFKGTVQLSGFVDTYAQKSNAASITKKVQGVRDVENDLTVKSDRSNGEYVDDKSLTARVDSALGNNSEYKFGEVNVTAFQGTVQLSGFVNNADQKTRAGEIAEHVQGVQNVVNNIIVKDKM
ncbi:MAG TPA: BON domain-containing protein [Dongiaceae bacterium]|jgi:hyperosmotically inducible protein|nr:BON domain-containing protein [Dongiaceae bacterium]